VWTAVYEEKKMYVIGIREIPKSQIFDRL